MCKTSNVDDYVRSFCWLNRSSPLIRNSGRDFWKLAAGVYIYIYVYQLIVCEDFATLHSHYVYSWNCSVSLEIDGTGLILDKGVQWSNKIQLSNQRQWKTMAVSWLVFSNSWISGNPLFFAAFHGMFPENSIRNFFEWFSFWEKTTFFSTEIWIRSIFFISSRVVILGGCQCASHQLQTRPHSAGTEFLEGFFLKDEDVESDMWRWRRSHSTKKIK